ncbi:hypothetical protein [Mycobacterium uberis]|uniref:hypothetical protein n=1 Tax=Mycobacterium uberis TaxID=2162698 RepID=UPI0014030449|nr:hypothetical protein [Mycobacterium uberis]
MSTPDSAPLIAKRANRIIEPGFVADKLKNLPVEVLNALDLKQPVLAECGLFGNRR